MARKYQPFINGLVSDNPLTNVATTLNSAGLASLMAVSGSDTVTVVLDPDGTAGAPEIVYITAHSASATSATIARGQEGTVARQHLQNTVWRHVVTDVDFKRLDTIEANGWVTAARLGAQAVTEAALHTSVAGAGLVGGNNVPLAVNPDGTTLEVVADAVQVKDLGVSAAKIAADAVTTVKILDANVTTPKLAANAVTEVKITDGVVSAAKHKAEAWTSFTPSVGWTVGNGTWDCAYIQLGKVVHFRIKFTVGSTTVWTTSPSFGLPVTAKLGLAVIATGYLSDADGGNQKYGFYRRSDGYLIRMADDSQIQSSLPITLATGDVFELYGTYEAA